MIKLLKMIACFICISFVIGTHSLYAQPGVSFSFGYDYFPYANFADPSDDNADIQQLLEEVEMRISTLKFKMSYPVALSERTFLMHELSYDRLNGNYKNWTSALGEKIELAHAVKYNLMLRHILSNKWYLVAFLTPGLASDFKAKLSTDDLSIEAALVFVRQFSQKFALGFGAAYSRQFGEPFPLPVLALEWNNGSNLRINAIVPSSFDLWYMLSPSVELGLVLHTDGNMYHGDEDIYGGSKPRMRYSVITIGPSVNVRFTDWLKMNVNGGYTLLRRFEFTNEDVIVNDINIGNIKAEYDLKNATFFKVGLQIGG
jgi:hypothetical protein